MKMADIQVGVDYANRHGNKLRVLKTRVAADGATVRNQVLVQHQHFPPHKIPSAQLVRSWADHEAQQAAVAYDQQRLRAAVQRIEDAVTVSYTLMNGIRATLHLDRPSTLRIAERLGGEPLAAAALRVFMRRSDGVTDASALARLNVALCGDLPASEHRRDVYPFSAVTGVYLAVTGDSCVFERICSTLDDDPSPASSPLGELLGRGG